MSPPKKRLFGKFIIGGAVLLLLLGTAFWYLGPALVERQLNRLDAAALFEKFTGGSFTSDRLQLDLLPLPHVVIPNARINIPGQLEGQWQNLQIYPSFSALLTGDLRVGKILIKAPDFEVALPRPVGRQKPLPHTSPTTQAIIPLLQNGLPGPAATLQNATITTKGGRLRITGISQPPIQVEGIDLTFQLPPADMTIDLRCRSTIWETLHLSGTLNPATFQGRLRLSIDDLKPETLRPLLPKLPFQWESAPLDVTAQADLSDRNHLQMAIQARLPRILLKREAASVAANDITLKSELTYSPANLRINLEKLQVTQPALSLSGHAVVNSGAPLYQVELTGSHLTIEPLRQASLALAGDNEVVAGIFDVLRGGDVPWIQFSTKGTQPSDMAVFRNMTIIGTVENGRLFIPGAELALTEVQGKADISKGILKGDHLKAMYGKTKGSDGRLWLDLDQEETVPFFLEIDADADLAPLPSLLAGWVDDTAFQGEMRRIRTIAGTADGRLILDGRGPDLDVTVDVAHCRVGAQYDRLPAQLSITEGMVQYTRDRIQVIHMSGKLGESSFVGLTGHVAFGGTPLLQVDNASAHFDLGKIIPWIEGYGLFENLPFSLKGQGGQLNLDRLETEGPLLHPDQWRFSAQGSARRLRIVSPILPGPADIESIRFDAGDSKLDIPEAHVRMSDADVTLQKTLILLKTYLPEAVSLTLSGKLGPAANAWISSLVNLEKSWQLKAPLAISAATLDWSANGDASFLGEMTTGGGTLVGLDVKGEGHRLSRQKVTVKDQDSQATLQVTHSPENLDVDFKGHITAATIGRMMQDTRYARGHVEGQFQAHIFPEHPGRSSVAGTLKAYDIHQPLPIAQRFDIVELSIEAVDNSLRLTPAVFEIDHQIHRITGSIAIEDNGYVLDVVHRANNVSLTLPETSSTGRPPPDPGHVSFWDLPLRGRIISRIDSLTVNGFQWSPFNAAIQIAGDRWDCRIEDAKLCGLETPGDILVTPKTVSIRLTPEAKNFRVERTMTCLLKKSDLLDGAFDLAGHLETQGITSQLDHSIQGEMEFHARKGRIYRFNLLSKVLAVVNLTEIFRGKIPDLMQGGLAYDQIDIQVDIKDSVCTIKQAVIDGASADIAAQGTVNLLTGQADMIVLVAPFKTIDAIVKYTPIIGDWLGGTLVSIPVKVSGPFADPTVTPLSPSAVGSSLMNLLENTVKLPVKIVEPLWKGNE